jgi:hypothetical protein
MGDGGIAVPLVEMDLISFLLNTKNYKKNLPIAFYTLQKLKSRKQKKMFMDICRTAPLDLNR